jgi:hypothetical protein
MKRRNNRNGSVSRTYLDRGDNCGLGKAMLDSALPSSGPARTAWLARL